ncbi:MAG: cysteine desulfurase family protein [Candidatus Gracilibacteria bacterium]
MQKIYLDNAATTQVLPEVVEAILPYFTEHYGNPSSIHQPGQEAHLGLNTARKTFARILGCTHEEIYFTSGATESTNTILRGVAHALISHGKHIITSSFEHSATLETCRDLESQGYEVTYLQPTSEGYISKQQVQEALRKDTILVSLIYVQNEIGTIQPVAEIGALLNEKGIFFHTDAVQAFQYLSCNVHDLHVSGLSLSGHKFHAPKGVGVMYINSNWQLPPLLTGGHQEFGMRSGTQNVANIAGMGKAAELAVEKQEEHKVYVQTLRDYAYERIIKFIPDAILNGEGTQTTPHILNLSFDGVDGETLLIRLDLEGIAVSTGAACSSEKKEPSHTLTAIGRTPDQAQGSIRISFSFMNTMEEVDYLVEKLVFHVGKIRLASLLN